MQALIVNGKGERAALTDVDAAELPDGEVTVEIAFSSLNYKDSLALLSASPVVREFPMVPGIDLVGKVTESDTPEFSAGDWVLVNGWGLGETRWGGFAELARVDAGMPIHLPAEMEPADAMAIGTAGYTAMLCVLALEDQGVVPDHGPVLVTGATGGVGLTSVLILSELGYSVVASTGKAHMASTLEGLGASQVIGRFTQDDLRPLGSERWAGVIDSVGSKTLAAALSAVQRGGVAVACGLTQGMDLPTTVMPFILRGVSLVGVDSVYQPRHSRELAWKRLARDLAFSKLRQHTRVVFLEEVLDHAESQLNGELTGRVVVDCSVG